MSLLIRRTALGRGIITPPPTFTTLWNPADKNAGITLSGGNLTASLSSGSDVGGRADHARPDGDFYWEGTPTVNTGLLLGLATSTANLNGYLGSDSSKQVAFGQTGWIQGPGVATLSGTTYGTGDKIGIRRRSGTVIVYKNGTAVWTFTSLPTGDLFPAYSFQGAGEAVVGNFGASAFSFLPTGSRGWNG